MELNILDFLDSRIEEIIKDLMENNPEYALAYQESIELYDSIDEII